MQYKAVVNFHPCFWSNIKGFLCKKWSFDSTEPVEAVQWGYGYLFTRKLPKTSKNTTPKPTLQHTNVI